MTSRTLADSGQTTTYVWTCMNRLRQRQVDTVPQETNAYDAGGIRRLKKDETSGVDTKYFSSGAMSVADKMPTGNTSFIQGGQLLGMLQNGNFYFYISDGLSSVRVLVDSTGTEAASASYNEFGAPENVSDSGGLMKHGYTGALGVRNETAGSGLMYMRQRWYDPGLGSWLSQDPIGFRGGLNLQGYVNQNPTNNIDPSGLELGYIYNQDGSMTGPGDPGYSFPMTDGERQIYRIVGSILARYGGPYGLAADGVIVVATHKDGDIEALASWFGSGIPIEPPSGPRTPCNTGELPTIRIGELPGRMIHPGSTLSRYSSTQRMGMLTDTELLQSVRNPAQGDFIQISTRTGNLLDGNTRSSELVRRAGLDSSSINWDMLIPYKPTNPGTF